MFLDLKFKELMQACQQLVEDPRHFVPLSLNCLLWALLEALFQIQLILVFWHSSFLDELHWISYQEIFLVLTMKCGSRHQSGELDRFWIIFNQALIDSMMRLIHMSPDEMISYKPSLSKETKRVLKMNFQKSMLLEIVQAIWDKWQAILWWGNHIVDLIFKTDQSNMLSINGWQDRWSD